MDIQNYQFIQLVNSDIDQILPLIQMLNPTQAPDELAMRMREMFAYANYRCFGLKCVAQQPNTPHLIAICGGWLTTRLYSGKQLELDNLIVDNDYQSMGVGDELFRHLRNWASAQGCITLELNTYITNSRSHKFYFNQGMKIIGYRFQKGLFDRS